MPPSKDLVQDDDSERCRCLERDLGNWPLGNGQFPKGEDGPPGAWSQAVQIWVVLTMSRLCLPSSFPGGGAFLSRAGACAEAHCVLVFPTE